jgi:hypothetical protein
MERDNPVNMPESALNAHQRRCLEVTFRMLEEALDHFGMLLEATPVQGVLYVLNHPYTPEEQATLRQRIEDVRGVLRGCQERWNLQVERKTLDTVIRSRMSVLWADLEDCRSSKLRRYGDVPLALMSEIDATVGQLIRLVDDFGSHPTASSS